MRAYQFTIRVLHITTASIDFEHNSWYAFAVGAEAANAFHMPVVSGTAHTRAGVLANWKCCNSNISAEYYMRRRPMRAQLPLSEPVSESVCSKADGDPFVKASADFVERES